jgi:uncharacterized protein
VQANVKPEFEIMTLWTQPNFCYYLRIVFIFKKWFYQLGHSVQNNNSEDDRRFIEEAALLHDIGVCQVHAPGLGLHGKHPYIMHGVLGRAILEREGYPLHALVSERHTGVGLTCEDIIRQGLPLPHRDMCPQSLSEQMVCCGDWFYSRKPERLDKRKTAAQVRKKLLPFGEEKVAVFDAWLIKFEWSELHSWRVSLPKIGCFFSCLVLH